MPETVDFRVRRNDTFSVKKLFIAVLVVLVFSAGWFWFALRPSDARDKQAALVRIESGESLAQIAVALQDQRLIRSALAFKIYARISGVAGGIKAGAFLVNPSESAAEILTILTTGKSQQVSVTIPEGYTVAEIDKLLASKGVGTAGDIVNCAFQCDFSSFDFLPEAAGNADLGYGSRLEGYLFPDTYYIDIADYQPKFFLERLLGTFRKRIVTPNATEVKQSKRTLADIVTMASLLEQESRGSAERPVVAGILWKRFDAGTVLGVDASIRYALQKPTESLTKTDLETDSTYNTRRKRGLPPSPIANPGESAFLAALRPEASEYWYYLHDAKGQIHYAVTNDEHNRNRALFLR